MIDLDVEGGLARITLNRPEKRNALTKAMLLGLREMALSLSVNDAVRAVVLTGEGPVFSAGADLDEARAGLATDPIWNAVSQAIADLPVLTIAALNGTAAGGALGMVLASDIIVASPEAKVFYPVMKLGFLPQTGDVARLVERAGPAHASMILLGGARLSADESLALQVVDHVSDAPVRISLELAAVALSADRSHGMAIKAMIRASRPSVAL